MYTTVALLLLTVRYAVVIRGLISLLTYAIVPIIVRHTEIADLIKPF
jgi:hypothetical protein